MRVGVNIQPALIASGTSDRRGSSLGDLDEAHKHGRPSRNRDLVRSAARVDDRRGRVDRELISSYGRVVGRREDHVIHAGQRNVLRRTASGQANRSRRG